ncbi:MAG: peptidylprolyl isomerase [Phycisphaerales bacterium]|nr:peptidylprolyl isomerase [Phycisphaerales bacterium]
MWNLFKKKGNAMATAQARHILVGSEQEAKDLKQQIESGSATFEDLAKAHSKCPSGREGGSLGTFRQGQMVPEFDKVVFGDLPIGKVSEPVKTQFGFHILEVQSRMN